MSDIYTLFPDEIQEFEFKEDVSIDTYSAMSQYNQYISNGQFEEAGELLQSNAELQKVVISAYDWNIMTRTLEETQAMFLDNVQTYIHEVVHNRGSFSRTNKYVKYDFVSYIKNGVQQTYECLSDDTPIGTLPTDTNYFVSRVIQGEKGVSGTGLSFIGGWKIDTEYTVDDMVTSGSAWWACRIANTSVLPSQESQEWEMIFTYSANASAMMYDNENSQLLATNVQDAVDELSDRLINLGVDDTPTENSDNLIKSSGVYTELEKRAPKNNPTFTGTPTAPTAVAGTNTTQIATTAYVQNAVKDLAGFIASDTAPTNTKSLWIDTSIGGVMKYYNGTAWVAIKSTWS